MIRGIAHRMMFLLMLPVLLVMWSLIILLSPRGLCRTMTKTGLGLEEWAEENNVS
jgi:hypothetical protein